MNKFERALDQLQKGIQSYVNKKIENAPFDRTTVGVVNAVDSNNLYTVTIDRKQYANLNCMFKGVINVGDVVKVNIPQNNYNLMYIIGKLNTEMQSGSRGTDDYTQLLNKPQINGNVLDGNKTTTQLGINIPTKLSDLTNDQNFIDNTVNNLSNYYLKTDTYTKTEVNGLISSIVTINISIVQTLPTTDISTNTIYLLPKTTAQTDNVYDEYINIDGTTSGWELIGDTEVDLSNYYTTTQVDNLLSNKVDKVSGKQLSTNDFTTALKTKLDGIESNAQVNVQSNWTESDSTSDAYIQNKPNIPTNLSIVDLIYPIGSVYVSTVNTNPTTYFGGTWVSVGESTLIVNNGTTQTAQYKWERTA